VRLYLDANHMPISCVEPSQGFVFLPMTMDIAVSLDNLRLLGLLPPGFSEHLPNFAIMFAAGIRPRELSDPADASPAVSQVDGS
jgi:hypothetical protein